MDIKNMQPHQQRVVDEKSELDDKAEKLLAFLESDTYRNLDETDKNLLANQVVTMLEYSDILGKRIARF